MTNLPDTLPERPTGWTKSLVMHMNLGRQGHVGAYRVCDANGFEMPIDWTYGPEGERSGFNCRDDPKGAPGLTWDQLREAWPARVESLRARAVIRHEQGETP